MRDILQYISNQFELILLINAVFMGGLLVVIVLAKLRMIGREQWEDAGKEFLRAVLIFGQALMLSLLFYIHINNIQPKPKLDFSFEILGTTDWVKSRQVVYYVDEDVLISIRADGENRQIILGGHGPVKQYIFSPDGKQLLVLTRDGLYVGKSAGGNWHQVAIIKQESAESKIKTIVSGLQWSPDSDHFVYRVFRWSQVSSQDYWYVYQTKTHEAQLIKSPLIKLTDLLWDQTGENLYNSKYVARDTSQVANPFEVRLTKIPIKTLSPEPSISFYSQNKQLPEDHLALRGIHLFLGNDRLSFGQGTSVGPYVATSVRGQEVGIDEEDILYVIPREWWKKRLYQIPRVKIDPKFGEIARYQYEGRLVIDHLAWFPSGRYVIMEHYQFGILILDPVNGHLGILDNVIGHTFGWYDFGAGNRK